MYTPTPPPTPSSQRSTTALELIRGEIGSLRQPRVVISGVDPGLPAGSLARVLWQVLGQRRARYLMTKLGHLDREVRLEGRLARRANGNATD